LAKKGVTPVVALGVVIGEFGKWKEFGPVILLIAAIDSEVLF